MINLLPPDIKSSIRYSRYNVMVLRYGLLLLLIGGLIGLMLQFVAAQAAKQTAAVEERLSDTRAEIEQFESVEDDVDVLQAKLRLVEQLLVGRDRYSVLLSDIAAVIPDNAFITSVVLTGDEAEPLELTMSVTSQQQAAEVRQALESSSRLTFVDIQNFTFNEESGRFTLNLSATFASGEAQ